MTAEDFREMDDNELGIRLEELKEERFRLKFRSTTMELDNPKLLGQIRKDVARILTIRRQREMSEA